MKLKLFIIFILFLPCFIFAQRDYQPWYTGPLLALSGNNLEKGKINVQPYLYFRDSPGNFNKAWGTQATSCTFTFHSELDFQAGLTKWLDVTFIGQCYYKDKEGEKSFEVGDTAIRFGIQLLKEKNYTAIPSIRIMLEENIPTGKYKNLNPNKLGIDASGSGSFETLFGFLMQKEVYWFKSHPISLRLNTVYTYSSKASVKNFNAYGGGYNTNGKASPGGVIMGIFSFEYSFTQRWVLATDLVHVYASKTTFKGTPGTTVDGEDASNSNKRSDQTSLAPALEYNFSGNLGVLVGAHFSLRRKNATKFKSVIISATYTF